MATRPLAALALCLLLLLAGCSVGYQPDAPEPSPPPESPHLGYYDGYWYNDTFDVDPSDGLTRGEERAVFRRAMARVQLLRGLAFEGSVDIRLVTRAQFRERYRDEAFPPPNESVRTLDNVQHEALFLVGPDTDVVEVRRDNRGGLVLGFYQSGPDRLVVVSRRQPATLADEITLAHELVHALQDQHFGLGSLQATTLDDANAQNGLVEGDATGVQQQYRARCTSGEWQCVDLEGGPPRGGGAETFHWGVYFVGFFPYAEGPTFVRHHRERGGWAAIDEMYDDVPTAAAEVVYPSTYDTATDTVTYGNATLTDHNDAEWNRVRTRRADYAEAGQSGLASMVAYTAYEDRDRGVIDRAQFRNRDQDGSSNGSRVYTYDLALVDGWYGDRLHAYTNDGETAYVWNVTFRDAANASAFLRGYERVLEFWYGERTGTRNGGVVWTFDEAHEPFHGAVWVDREGTSLTIVKAPRRGQLDDVYGPAGGTGDDATTTPPNA